MPRVCKQISNAQLLWPLQWYLQRSSHKCFLIWDGSTSGRNCVRNALDVIWVKGHLWQMKRWRKTPSLQVFFLLWSQTSECFWSEKPMWNPLLTYVVFAIEDCLFQTRNIELSEEFKCRHHTSMLTGWYNSQIKLIGGRIALLLLLTSFEDNSWWYYKFLEVWFE